MNHDERQMIDGLFGRLKDAERTAPPRDAEAEGFIRDRGVTARMWPHKPDSYLLIMAGPDHIYGTDDDLTNFR